MRLSTVSLVLLSLVSSVAAAADLRVDRRDPRLDAIIAPDAEIEILASGFDWSEGPVWDRANGRLLFSDIPKNTVFAWEGGSTIDVFLMPSGYTGPSDDYSREPGSNGLAFDADGRLILCQHGDRRIARLLPDGAFETVADRWEGKRLNSPNDLAVAADGAIYFTDPPYGLPRKSREELSETGFCGVYRVDPAGEVTLLTKELNRPNGIAFSPDGSTLYVADSDPQDKKWVAFDVRADGTLGPMRTFFAPGKGEGKGGCDGLKVAADGTLFATGPGGVWVFTPEGEPLGKVVTGERIANCAFGGPDGSTLYMTSDMHLARIATRVVGAGW